MSDLTEAYRGALVQAQNDKDELRARVEALEKALAQILGWVNYLEEYDPWYIDGHDGYRMQYDADREVARKLLEGK